MLSTARTCPGAVLDSTWARLCAPASAHAFPAGIEQIEAASAPIDLETVESYRSVMKLKQNGEIKCFFLA